MSAIESPHAKDPEHRSIGQRLATEMRRFVGMFAYLCVIFGIYVLAERIILREGFHSQRRASLFSTRLFWQK